MQNDNLGIDVETSDFINIMKLYEFAMMQVVDKLDRIKGRLKEVYRYPIIDEIEYRIKSKESILEKMRKKGYHFDYISLTQNINDIAGIRIVCPLKEDIHLIRAIIEELPNIRIVEVKDYISKPKKSGYSAYHMIIETPIHINGNTAYLKVEIQIRTTAMNFWAKLEHDARYKGKENMSRFDSRKLTWYAKMLDTLQSKIIKIYRKQEMKMERENDIPLSI